MEEKKTKKQRTPEEQAKIDRMLEGLRKKREADKAAKEQKKAAKETPKPVDVPVAPPPSLIETPLVSTKSKEEKTERWNKLYSKLDEIEKSVKAKPKTKKIVMEESSSDEEIVVVKKTKPKKVLEPEVAGYIEKPVAVVNTPTVVPIKAVPEPIVGSSEWLRKQLFGK